jgi:hypothetical protein
VGWLRPFIGILLVSCGLSVAATFAVDRAWGHRADASPTLAIPHWVNVTQVDEDGSRQTYECLARPEFPATGAVVIQGGDLEFNDFRQNLCLQFRTATP